MTSVGLNTSFGFGQGANPGPLDLAAQNPQPSSAAGGDTGWLGSWHDPLGIVSGLKNIGVGLATSIGGGVANLAEGVGALATTPWNGTEALSTAGSHFAHAGQAAGDIAGGLALGVEGLATDAADVATLGFADQGTKDFFGHLNAWLGSGAKVNGGNELFQPFSNTFEEQLYNKGAGYKPLNFADMASKEGLFGASMQTAASAAIVAGPVAGIADTLAGNAAQAAGDAIKAGALEDAAKFSAREDMLTSVAKGAQTVVKAGQFGFNPFSGDESIPAFLGQGLSKYADKASLAGEDATASLIGKLASVANKVAHPFETVGEASRGVLQAMFDKGYPTTVPVPAEPGTPVTPEGAGAPEGTQGAQAANPYQLQFDPAAVIAARSALPPEVAGAEGLAQAASNPTPVQQVTGTTVVADFNQEGAPLVEINRPDFQARRDALVQQGYTPDQAGAIINQGFVPQELVTPGMPGTASAPQLVKISDLTPGNDLRHPITPPTGEEAPIVVQKIGDELRVVEGNHRLAAEQAAGSTHVSVVFEQAPDQLGGLEQMLNEQQAKGEQAPGVTPKVEPAKYKIPATENLPPDPAVQAVADAQLRAESAQAREETMPQLTAVDRIGRAIQTPVPDWARQIVDVMVPPSVARLLGRLGMGWINEVRLRNAARNIMQAAEVTQNYARNSEAMVAGKQLAAESIYPALRITRAAAEDIAGQEIHARINGELALAEWAKNLGPASPEVQARIDAIVRGDYPGLTQAMRDKFTPEQAVAFEQHVQDAVKGFKAESANTLRTLLASRYGAQGLEAAVLDPDSVPMNREQIRQYKGIQRDLRKQADLLLKVPGERARAEANAALADSRLARRVTIEDGLRRRLGTREDTIAGLHRGFPDGFRNEGRVIITLGLDELQRTGGAILDVAPGNVEHPTEGTFVATDVQPSVPFSAGPEAVANAVHEAIFFPKTSDGTAAYDPIHLYSTQGARLSLNIATDPTTGEMVLQPVIGFHSLNGEAMSPGQAAILGAAHESPAGYNFADGSTLHFPTAPMEQTAAKWYVADLFDPKSRLNAWIAERQGVIDELNIGRGQGPIDRAQAGIDITPEQFIAVQSTLLTLDRAMAERNPGWKQGDIFNTKTEVGKGLPTLPALFQTVMPLLSSDELQNTHLHFIQAMTNGTLEQVNRALKWYYDSHDTIETLFRNRVMPSGRNAAEFAYDAVALSSVMADPTTNLGRALATMDNMEQLIQQHQMAYDNAIKLTEEMIANKPQRMVWVRNIDRPNEEVSYTKQTAKGWTQVPQRYLDSPIAREMTQQTSMITAPKYRIIDLMLGKLDLSNVTAETLDENKEWWTGKHKPTSDANLPREAVIKHAGLLNLRSPEFAAYRDWAVAHEELIAARSARERDNWQAPITDSEDFQRKRAEAQAAAKGETILGGRRVSPGEYQDLVNSGRGIVEQHLAESSPHGLRGDVLQAAKDRAWADIQHRMTLTGEDYGWGGATINAHTGLDHNAQPNEMSVTARLPGDKNFKEIAIPETATRAQFDAAIDKAVLKYAKVLNSDGGMLGVFHNVDTHRIEIDPNYIAQDAHEAESIGTYTHSIGGAFHFGTFSGYWMPHVDDNLTWSNKADASKAQSASFREGQRLAKTGDMRQAYENAMMEHHGGGLIAKMRSFRDNLANPHESLAVTLDSIMAQLWGYDQTYWGGKGNYSSHADMVRQVAAEWSAFAGRRIMPHEVQAVLWVYAKRYIGQQDWGRMQAHLDNTFTLIDRIKSDTEAGVKYNLRRFDPFANWWHEELKFHQDQQAIRDERKPLQMKRTAAEKGGLPLTPAEEARLAELEAVPNRTQNPAIYTAEPGGKIETVQRAQTAIPKNELSKVEDRQVAYYREVLAPARKALAAGDYQGAKDIFQTWANGQQKSMLSGMDGESFGPEMIRKGLETGSVTGQRVVHMAEQNYGSRPNVEGIGIKELHDSFHGLVRGATLEGRQGPLGRILMRLYHTADVTTLLHENLHAFRLAAPGDEVAQLSDIYPHIQDATLTPERIADEERFVRDFTAYLHDYSVAGDTRMSPAQRASYSPQYQGPLKNLWNNIADLVNQHQDHYSLTPGGQSAPAAVKAYWDGIFKRDLRAPDLANDPLRQGYTPRSPTPEQLRGESDYNYQTRLRQFGEAKGKALADQVRIQQAAKNTQEAQKFANQMHGMLLEPTPSELLAAKYGNMASAHAERLATQLDNAIGNQLPTAWRPFMAAVERMRLEFAADPALAPLAQEIPQNFAKALEFAAKLGFDPTHMPELTFPKVQQYMEGHLSLSTQEQKSGLRKENTGVLAKGVGTGALAERSLASLGAGTVMAMQELLTSRLIQFVEENYARQWDRGVGIPKGWASWDSARGAILARRAIGGELVSVNSDKIVPEAVFKTLQKLQDAPADMPFRFLLKGGPTAVWKNLLLTYSPTWYLKHFIGSVTLATLEGVRLQDWRVAWKQFRDGDLPFATIRNDINHAVFDELQSPIMNKAKVSDFNQIRQTEGYKQLGHEVNNKLRSLVSNVDSLSRAAVYARTLRLNEGNVGLAMERAYNAIGDFNRLGPLERGIISNIIPFYSFQKAMFRILLRMPADHPMATAAFMQLGLMNEDYLKRKLGAVPENYASAIFDSAQGGSGFMALDKMNPLTDSYKLVTPQGIAASLNPFIKPLVQQAIGQNAFGSLGNMTGTGALSAQPDFSQTLKDAFTANPIFKLEPPNAFVESALSKKQYDALVKRIMATNKAFGVLKAGGHLKLDANPAKKQPSIFGKSLFP